MFALVILSPLIWVIYKNVWVRKQIAVRKEAYQKEITLSEADKTELAASIVQARNVLEEDQRKFVVAMTPGALSQINGAEQPCPARMRGPTIEAGESYVKHGSIDMNYFGNADFRLFPREDAIDSWVHENVRVVDGIAAKLTQGKADRRDLERVQKLVSSRGTELFVVGELRKGGATGDSYTPSELTGRAYLYSNDEGRVVCVAPLNVRTNPTLVITYSHSVHNESVNKSAAADLQLERDLNVEIRRAIAKGLVLARQ